MLLEAGSKSIPFDFDEMMRVIFGERADDNYSSFLGKKDMEKGTGKDEILTSVRDGKDYNLFGKTRKIEF